MIDEEDSITLPPITDFEPLRVYSIYVWIFSQFWKQEIKNCRFHLTYK
jgi:hypothetical protein